MKTKATSSIAVTTVAAIVFCVAHLSCVSAAFYVCPSTCQALLLPRDMETLEDCLCQGDISALLDNNQAGTGAFRCPEGSAAKRTHPLSFADCSCLSGYTRDDMRKVCSPDKFKCRGRYRLKEGFIEATSIADCDCQHPYKKDEATGQCIVRKCPRAGNYIKKSTSKKVTSLADCECIDPYIKNDQSGECLVDVKFECPDYSSPLPNRRPVSFADCECDWGFVRTTIGTCEREAMSYACPPHSVKRLGLPLGARPSSFADCECEASGEFRRNNLKHTCDRINKDVDGDGNEEIDEDELDGYECPAFSRPLAPVPHSIQQCECLPGYGWKTPEMICVRLSGYSCPLHSYKFDDNKHVEESFKDCECARGYYRDEANGACLEWFLANDNGCPDYAFLHHWPLQSKANCQCIYGLSTPAPETTPEAVDEEEEDDEDTKAQAKKLRQRKNRQEHLIKKKPKAQCNKPPPEILNIGFSQCPENSVAISWPIASSDDCMCRDGFDVAPPSEDAFNHGDGASFICVDPKEAITDDAPVSDVVCKPPMQRNPFSSDCRLPVENVVPTSEKKKLKDSDVTVPTRGEVMFKGIEYDYVLTEDDIMVIQGDIAIGELVAWQGDRATDKPTDPTPILHGYYNSDRDHRWKDATMCYEIDTTASPFAETVSDAMDHISSVTNFKFLQCRNNACAQDTTCSHDYVVIKRTASSCYSYVGRIGGRQLLGVSAQCGLGNVMHVLLHAVGLHHTIDRMDRDDHVRIAWECIPENQRSNFIIEDINATQPDSTPIDTPYDFFSIMHHPPNAFVHSKTVSRRTSLGSAKPQWCQSVFPIIAVPDVRVPVMASMGQRELLAVTDIHAVWRIYPKLQQQDKPPVYESTADGDKPVVHESRLHTQDDVVVAEGASTSLSKKGSSGKSWGRKISSFFGAMFTLVAFGAFVSFAVAEFRRRALLRGNGAYYSESLLTDKSLYD